MHRTTVILTSIVMLAGCASQPTPPAAATSAHTGDVLSIAHDDLTIDATILTGRRAQAAIRRAMRGEGELAPLLEVQRQPARLVLTPGGELHAGRDPRRGADWLPVSTRVLDREQIAGLWALARQLGLGDPANADYFGNPLLIEAGPDELVHLIELRADGHHWTFVRRAAYDAQPDPASTALIRRMADLAWMGDDAIARPVPVRYDFGPDPYARFRRQPAATK